MARAFKKTKLIDDTLAQEGIDVRAERFGHYVGTFRVRYVNGLDPRVEKELNRIRKRHMMLRKVSKLEDLDAMIVVLADYAILDWSDIEDEDGAVPFSPEDAIDFLSDPDNSWIVLKLIGEASDGENFQPLESIDPAKN